MVTCYEWTHSISEGLGLMVRSHLALSLHSSNKPRELLQWLVCQDDSTINIHIGFIRPHHSTCYRWSSTACLSVMTVNPAKVAEPVAMPFGMLTRVGPRNHI